MAGGGRPVAHTAANESCPAGLFSNAEHANLIHSVTNQLQLFC
jgi:hypothetical protein